MSAVHQLITDHLDIWTAADTEKKTGRGRASGNANTVYGIKKLRELILELAVRGKLVPQDPNDEPASELVKRINAEKKTWTKEGKIRNSKALPKIELAEESFVKPNDWEWIRLGELGDWGAGATPSRANSSYYGGTIPWFKSGELTADFIDTSEETVTELALKECSLRLNQPGDVLIAMYGATIGKTAILKTIATTNQAVCACTPCTGILNTYLLVLLKALKANFIGQGAGGAQPNISREKIIATVAALPPTEEQHRIVAKVDELMALCDQLEAQHNNAADAHEQLVSHLLNTLTQSQDAADFNANWQRIATHFDTLFTTESSIDALKQTLLQLAVMGKLVPQDPNDEPASELLKRIQAEKAKLVGGGKIRTEKLPSNFDENIPHSIPNHWEWVTIGNISEVGTGATPLRTKIEYFNPPSIPWVTSGETSSSFIYKTEQFVSPLALDETNLTVYPKGTLIVAMYGQGKTRGQITELMIDACTNQACAAIKLVSDDESHRKYVKLFFEKIYDEIRDLAAGGAQPNLNLSKVKETLLPLPPLREQHRIVIKINELMVLCDELIVCMKNSVQCKKNLADVAISKAGL